jgi:hypothetical protein
LISPSFCDVNRVKRRGRGEGEGGGGRGLMIPPPCEKLESPIINIHGKEEPNSTFDEGISQCQEFHGILRIPLGPIVCSGL